MFTAHVRVTLRPSILDPQGQAVERALHSLGLTGIAGVRTGKHIALTVDAPDAAAARAAVEEACRKLLANPVTEDAEIVSLEPA